MPDRLSVNGGVSPQVRGSPMAIIQPIADKGCIPAGAGEPY